MKRFRGFKGSLRTLLTISTLQCRSISVLILRRAGFLRRGQKGKQSDKAACTHSDEKGRRSRSKIAFTYNGGKYNEG